MSSIQKNIKIQVSPVDDVSKLLADLKKMTQSTEDGMLYQARSKGIPSTELTDIILTLGSTGIILQLARIILKWLDTKENRTAVVNGKILRGYSAEEVVTILQTTSEKNNENILKKKEQDD